MDGGTPTLEEEAMPAFQEWFIYDYVTTEGERVIDLFAREKGPRLPAAQRQMLDDWRRTNRYHLFEVQEVEPGVGATVQDLLSGEVLEVSDLSASYELVKWQVVLMRPLLTNGRMSFAGSAMPLPPKYKPRMLKFAQKLWKKHRAQHPQASLDDFYQSHGLDLYQQVVEIATMPPSVYTPEGHPLLICTARYAVKDHQAVRSRLDQAEEFMCIGPAEEDETALAYVWLLTGRSRIAQAPIRGEEGMIMQIDMIGPSGKAAHRPLGDIRLWRDRLELACLSRERLKAGKKLLRQTLGRLVRHQGDESHDLDIPSPAESPASELGEPLAKGREEILRQVIATRYKEWLDEPIPMLGGESPRQAAQNPAMKEQLEELLKNVEYIEEQRRRAGEPYIEIAEIRRDLGL